MNWFILTINVAFFLGALISICRLYRNQNKASQGKLNFSVEEQIYRIGFSDGQSGRVKKYDSEAYLDGYSDGQKKNKTQEDKG